MAEAASGGLIGTLYLRLTAKDELTKKVTDAEKVVTKSADKMGKSALSLTKILAGLATAFGIHQISSFIHQVIDGTDELKKFSEELGVGIDKLAGFKFAADKANVGDKFEMGMRKFAEAMREAQVEGSAMQTLFKELAIDPTKGLDKAFEDTVDIFGKWEDGVNKVGVAQELFGTRNARFVNLLSGGTKGLKKETEELARVMGTTYEEAAQAAEDYNDSITTLKAAFTGVALVVLKEVLPHLTKFTLGVSETIPKIKEALTASDSWAASLMDLAKKVIPVVVTGLKTMGETITGSNGLFLKFWESGMGRWIDDQILSVKEYTQAYRDMQRVASGGFFKKSEMAPTRGSFINAGKIGSSSGAIDDKTMQDITEANRLMTEMGVVAQRIGPDLSAGLKAAAPNIEQLKADKAAMDKFMNESMGDRRGLRMDIAGLSGIEGMSEAVKMTQDKDIIEEKLTEIQKLRDSHFEITAEQEARLTEMEALYAEKRKAIAGAEMRMRLQIGEQMFSDLASIAKNWAGEQTGIYKALFAASKAFAIAESTVKIFQGIASAAALPFPANLPAMASVIAATASIVSSISAVSLEFGGERRLGGPVGPGKAFLVGEEGPELFAPSGSGTIVPNDRLMGEGKVSINIINQTPVIPVVTERMEGDERKIDILFKQFDTRLAANIKEGTGNLTKSMENTYQMRRGSQ